MRKILKIFILLILLIFLPCSIKAINCKYPDAGITISYDKNSAPHVISNSFASSGFYKNILGIVKIGSKISSTPNIEVDQTLFEKYQGKSCPTNMQVCYYSDSSIDLPSLKTAAVGVVDWYAAPFCAFGVIDSKTCDMFTDNSYSFMKVDVQTLYILTESEYKNHEIRKYEGGVMSTSLSDNFWDGYEAGSNYDSNLSWITGGMLGLGNVIWQGLTVDSIIGEGIKWGYYRNTNCKVVAYKGKHPAFDVNCGTLQNLVFKFRDAMDTYKKCSDESCKSENVSNVKKSEDEIKDQCRTILSKYDYAGAQKGCMEECFNIREKLNEYKKGTDLYENLNEDRECFMSDEIIAFIYNVLKWVKYIAPVLVIILGILDFVKALAAQDDDAMKKAQGKFVKRLVAAVLLFLLPLIIDYVLSVFNLVKDSCDINKIF